MKVNDSLKIRHWGSPDDVGATKLMFEKGEIIFGRRLANRFNMDLTGMKKHISVLELAGLVTTHKIGRDARFDALDQLLNELKPGNRIRHHSTQWRAK